MSFPKTLAKIALASFLGAGSSLLAHAADMRVKAPVKAPPPIASWSGFYIGAGVGFRSSDTDVNVTSARSTALPAVFNNDLFFGRNCVQGLPCVTGHPFNGIGVRGTIYLGYNWQVAPAWVLGLEGDVGFARQTTTRGGYYPATPFPTGNLSNSFSVKTEWDASIRGRAGYLIDPAVMVYATGGASWLRLRTTSNCSTLDAADGDCSPSFTNFAPASIANTQDKLGYTVGGGLEAMLWPNWILRGEYRYSDYGRVSYTDVRSSAAGVQTVSYDTKINTHTATFGLAYKFGNATMPGNSLAAYAAAPSAFSWTGLYIGAGVGVRANDVFAETDTALLSFPGAGAPINLLSSGCCFTGDPFDSTSVRVSPHIGYNWQFDPRWVVGLEGDFGFADRKVTHSGTYLPGSVLGGTRSLNDSYSIRTSWDASIRARLGYLVNPSMLLYVTGGAAWIKVEDSSECATAFRFIRTAPGFVGGEFGACAPGLRTPASLSHSVVKPGFTVGAGGEMKIWSNWIARAEYRYADFGTINFDGSRTCVGSATASDPGIGTITINCAGEVDTVNIATRVRTHSAMFGVSYKFD